MVGESDLKQYLELAKSLAPGDKVQLEWSHDYVTVGGSSGPDRPVTNLARETPVPESGSSGSGVWEGAEALNQQREMAAQWQRERNLTRETPVPDSRSGGSGVWEGAEALQRQREMAAQWQRERAAAQEMRRQINAATQRLEADSTELEQTLSQIAELTESATVAAGPKPGPPASAAVAAPEVTERREALATAGRNRRAALLAARRAEEAGRSGDGAGGAGGPGDAHGRFPAHWGEPPRMQTKDLRRLPGGYGMGSGTLRSWIQQKMAEDVAIGR